MNSEPNLDRAFAALSDPTRRAILARLARGETTVSELAGPFSISLPAISRHLRVLERARLISQRRDGQFRKCSLNMRGIRDISDWLAFYRRFWSESLERLDTHLKANLSKKEKTYGKRDRS
jgi:DNA-binding transcriptional ArsR family regulator